MKNNDLQEPNHFVSEWEKKEFVHAAEADFEIRLRAVASDICADSTVRLIALSGPTCSGKTTAANLLIEELKRFGKNVHVVSIDDFYYNKDYLRERAEMDPTIDMDYDSIDTIDFNALIQCVAAIFSEKKTYVDVPIFDFVSGKRTGYRSVTSTERDVFIFEGIQALYPEISAEFEKYSSVSVHICAESGILVADTHFEPNEIRLLRRIVRDYYYRATTPVDTMQMWKSVRENEQKNIFPYVDRCRYRIDSTMSYEIGMLKPHLEKILCEVPPDSEFATLTHNIINKIQVVQPLSSRYLSENSLYHEFVK
ncbi:MAG: hypothetical protein MSA49_00940 [Clostridia bacterium]|nr:hypothetical protein [Clostridia bacterium]